MTDDNGQFKDKITEWRGYTLRALEDISRELAETKGEIKQCNDKIDKLNSRLTGVQIKVAAIGGTSGLIVSILLYVLGRI
jgi:hypothetical protein